jgi:fructokinase
MPMPSVYAIGETIYDIIFEEGQPVAARAGGAMLNAAVSLGRCGQHVHLITELGDDRIGRQVLEFLQQNGVGTASILPYKNFNTPVSLAFLDPLKSASYSFYKHYPEDRLTQDLPGVMKGDIVLFGSFYSLHPDIREKLVVFLRNARDSGAFIIYDPNIRKSHLHELKALFPFVMENISLATLVRGSDEDFENLFNSNDPDKLFTQLSELGCNMMIITRGEKGATMISDKMKISVRAKKINTVSTIGAGDSFNAGIIYGMLDLMEKKHQPEEFGKKEWQHVLGTGTAFAADTCSGYDNYISPRFATRL